MYIFVILKNIAIYRYIMFCDHRVKCSAGQINYQRINAMTLCILVARAHIRRTRAVMGIATVITIIAIIVVVVILYFQNTHIVIAGITRRSDVITVEMLLRIQ